MDTNTPPFTQYIITGGTGYSTVLQLELAFTEEAPGVVKAAGTARINDLTDPDAKTHTYLVGYSFDDPDQEPGTFNLSGTLRPVLPGDPNDPFNKPNCSMKLVFEHDRLCGAAGYAYLNGENKDIRIENACIVIGQDAWNN